jgi:octaprenyl-diphosphate synthase
MRATSGQGSALALHAEADATSRPAAAPLDRLAVALKGELRQVETLLSERAASPVATIPDLSGYLIAAGGKRLRPILTLAAARAAGGRSPQAAAALAAAVEFIHTATLLHDDVIDDSDLRRGKAAAKNLWGASASILVGDFLFARAFTLMVETRDLRILDILSRAACVIAEGEVRQLAALGRPDLAIPEYLEIVEAKTAALFAAATRAGALAGGGDDALAAALGEYGRRLGRAFQLVDDLLDYGGLTAVIGKSVGDDFREGKLTLPVLLAREAGGPRDREFWDRTMAARDQREGDLSQAIRLIRQTGAAEGTLQTARREAEAARAALDGAVAGDLADDLADLADFCVTRAR